jgi:hypothetical protein
MVGSTKGKKITLFWDVSLLKILRLSVENAPYIFREVEYITQEKRCSI